jgi:small subunit ribosomal protein S9
MVEKKTATAKTVKKVVKAVKPAKVEKAVKAVKKAVVKTTDKPLAASRASGQAVVKAKALPDHKFVPAMGKRKTASASIRMRQNGTGQIIINGKSLNEYFPTAYQRKVVEQPLKQTVLQNMDFSILVKGGGKTGQADACRLGIAKLLIKLDPELRPAMRAKGWVTRDSRKKERKKPGLKRARRAPQWSKR